MPTLRRAASYRVMVDEGLSAPRLDLDEPQDEVAVAFAGPAHGPELVDDGRLQREPLAGSGSKATKPTGRVEVIASKAAGVMARRIMRQT